ncbi:type IV toxin-antitoxin system AbiEi family antitoxin domain-containing protein [Thiothrix winogradskyi]|uniref:Type IV toxin-antitoxin system AbiEi family antitoxin n=1 Tax=Thiothrix winogradskyi TaxID=96472 RepID=A0ABY3T035_9GAMM|nr:type IV toxin-antitoxin system AbiEi family antitoxin domain-containing protein [Thiothrix winogradskyi]UJS24582.1 type IV toxin-antitoxin system AbiEi family antitoxin [Thiothrix winogradskyi]
MQNTNITNLSLSLPDGLVVDRSWLQRKGFTRPHIDYLIRSGKLQSVGRGAYRRPGPPLKWQHFVYSLQEQGYSIHVGGRSALDLQGFAHYLPLGGIQTIDLYGISKLPTWLQEAQTMPQFKACGMAAFNPMPPQALTTQPFGHWDWLLPFATPELALFELLAQVRDEADFSLLDKYVESSPTLRPELCNALLQTCGSIKAKRLFLWFAARHQHPWLSHLETVGVNLGSGKRMMIAGGVLDKTYQITVPRRMMEEQDAPDFF